MSVHLPIEHLVGRAVFGFADLLGMQGAGYLGKRNELLKAEPGKCFITPHYDSYPGILVRLSQVDPGEVTELITESWRICAPKRSSPPTTRSTHLHLDLRNSAASKPSARIAANEDVLNTAALPHNYSGWSASRGPEPSVAGREGIPIILQ
jgi:hypothetical protein